MPYCAWHLTWRSIMKQFLSLIALLSLCGLYHVSEASALPLGFYQLDPSPELNGSFSYDPAHENQGDNPFTTWSFQYDWPSVIQGAQWNTADGGFWYSPSQSLLVTNPDNLTLTFQFCLDNCGNNPQAYNMSIFDNVNRALYSAGGTFAVSVPEPSALWMAALGLALLGWRAWRRV